MTTTTTTVPVSVPAYSEDCLRSLQVLSQASIMSMANISHVLSLPRMPVMESVKVSPQEQREKAVQKTATSTHSTTAALASHKNQSKSDDKPTTTRRLSERQSFLLFIKIYCLYMKHTRVASHQRRVQHVIQQCTAEQKRCTSGGALMPRLSRALRAEMGEIHYARALYCFRQYCATHGIETVEEDHPPHQEE